MKKIVLLTVTIVFLGTFLLAESPEIAYINSDRILENSKDGQRIQTIIKTLEEEWNNQITEKEQILQEKYDEYQNQPVMVDENFKKEKEKEIIALEEEYVQLKREIAQKAKKKQDELLFPILQKLGIASEKIALEKGYSAIFDLNMSGLVYIDQKLDVTDLVVEEMNKIEEIQEKIPQE